MLHLKLASASFAEDTRHQVRSRIGILQALDNEVDSVKEALQKGSTFWKENLGYLTAFRCCFIRFIFPPTYGNTVIYLYL
jgi:hypothetical protein